MRGGWRRCVKAVMGGYEPPRKLTKTRWERWSMGTLATQMNGHWGRLSYVTDVWDAMNNCGVDTLKAVAVMRELLPKLKP